MQDDLLWVYEGLTNYLGTVLTARSGLAHPAASSATIWRAPPPLWIILRGAHGETCKTLPMPLRELYFSPQAWDSWRRGTDFYDEDTLNWLWVDTIIRQQSKGKKSHR